LQPTNHSFNLTVQNFDGLSTSMGNLTVQNFDGLSTSMGLESMKSTNSMGQENKSSRQTIQGASHNRKALDQSTANYGLPVTAPVQTYPR